MPHLNVLLSMVFLFSLIPSWGHAVEVGKAIQVTAGKKIVTRNQTWASVAWAEKTKCWLIVWREGYLNEEKSELWCARVSATGKTLDPDGIKVTTDEGLKDIPKVASNGTDFLITWDDFRNKKDWDTYAARVSGNGVVLDKKPMLIAGGAHNQCRSAVAFAKGSYAVLWMAFAKGKYDVFGTHITSDGKVGATPIDVSGLKVVKRAKVKQALLPIITANAEGELLSAFYISQGFSETQFLARQVINPETGGPLGKRAAGNPTARHSDYPGASGWFRQRTFAIALGPQGAMVAGSAIARLKSKKDVAITQLSKAGEVIKTQELGSNFTSDNQSKSLRNRPALAFDGTSYLIVADCPVLVKGTTERNPEHRARLIGWRSTWDSKIENANGFVIAGDDGYDCLLPAVSAGPKGVCLLVYSAIRGVDDVKVMARIIR